MMMIENDVRNALQTLKDYCNKFNICSDDGCVLADNCPKIADKKRFGWLNPSKWDIDEIIPSCKPQNDPSDASKTDKGIIGRIEKLERKVDDLDFILDENTVKTHDGRIVALERQVGGLKGLVKSQTIVIDDLVKRLNELNNKVYTLEKWVRS